MKERNNHVATIFYPPDVKLAARLLLSPLYILSRHKPATEDPLNLLQSLVVIQAKSDFKFHMPIGVHTSIGLRDRIEPSEEAPFSIGKAREPVAI